MNAQNNIYKKQNNSVYQNIKEANVINSKNFVITHSMNLANKIKLNRDTNIIITKDYIPYEAFAIERRIKNSLPPKYTEYIKKEKKSITNLKKSEPPQIKIFSVDNAQLNNYFESDNSSTESLNDLSFYMQTINSEEKITSNNNKINPLRMKFNNHGKQSGFNKNANKVNNIKNVIGGDSKSNIENHMFKI